MERMPSSKVKKQRQAMLQRFTSAGEPGAGLLPVLEAFLAALRLPPGVVGSPEALAAGLEGEQVLIVPAFFDLLVQLKRVSRSFTLVFRTFGEDLPKVVKEHNAFCEGRHPMYPGVHMDGSDGGPDYRVNWSDPMTFGCFFRGIENNADALILGTLEQPQWGHGLDLYQDTQRFPHIHLTKGGIHKVHGAMRDLLARPRTVAIKDYWDVWRHTGEGQDASLHNFGKLLTVDNNPDMQGIFFDDNILPHNPKIVDVRHIGLKDKVFTAMYSLANVLHRADMFDAVLNRQYYINAVDEKSADFEKRVAVRARFLRVLKQAAITCKLKSLSHKEVPVVAEEDEDRDPWHGYKAITCMTSTVVAFRDLGPLTEEYVD